MSQVQYEASGSEVSKVESDIAQTVNLADTVVNLIREPIVLLYQNISKKKALHASLGIWKDEALDDEGRCRIPVMHKKGIEDHLVETNGIVESVLKREASPVPKDRQMFRFSWAKNNNLIPSRKSPTLSPGTACWAYFLHSLGIRPGMKVVGWRPVTGGYINTQNGGIEMEVDGAALCHVINLYSVLPVADNWGHRLIKILPDPDVPKSCSFAFGKLAWDTVDGHIHAHFTPGVEDELGATKQPFGEQGSFMEPGTVMASYLSALTHGASDPQFLLPSPKAPLRDRVTTLARCLPKLRAKSDGLLLLSCDWIRNASRIKRRVLTHGGEDHSFYEDICKTLDLIPYERSWGDESSEKEGLKAEIYELFPFSTERRVTYRDKEERFNLEPKFCLNSVHEEPSSEDYFIEIWEVIGKTLDGYSDQPPGSWRRGLFEMKDEVIKLLCITDEVIIGNNVYILHFTESTELWNKTVLLC